MPSIPWIPTVSTIANGADVSAQAVNPILSQFTQREQFLYERFGELTDKALLLATDKAVHPDDLSLVVAGSAVYFKDDGVDTGLALAKASFTSTNFASLYSPDNSSFVFGIVKSVATLAGGSKQADVYLHGLIQLANDIDDPINGLLESGSTFAVGPYYLSRRESGKLSRVPGGVAVFVGCAISKTEFLLNPSVDELTSFFIHYKYNILDRPNGTPTLTGSTWTIVSPDVSSTAFNRVGWVGVGDVPINICPTANIPSGAKFFYGLPAELLTDDAGDYAALDNPGISDDEKAEAKSLLQSLPPYPADFTFLSVNGLVSLVRDFATPAGVFSIDQYGLWWYDDQAGGQPWASDIGSGTFVPADWDSNKGSEYLRPRMVMQFLKFNPDLRVAMVTSLEAFNDSTNDSSELVKFYSKSTGEESTVGDLQVKVTIPVTSELQAPILASAVKTVTFDAPSGELVLETSPVVTSIVGINGITSTTNGTTGVVTLSSQSTGLYGAVDSLEPENARLEYIGLHSYLNLVDSAVLPTGIVGKIVLPPSIVASQLNLNLMLFGKTATGSQKAVNFNFEYSVSTPKSLVGVSVTLNPNITSLTTAGPNPISVNLPAAAYVAYEEFIVTPTGMSVPATKLVGNTIVNFRISRTTSTYTGDIGILGVYWQLG